MKKWTGTEQVQETSVDPDPDLDWIWIQSGQWIRIRNLDTDLNPGVQNDPQK